MKARLTMLKLLMVLCATFATTAVFGQTIFSWTGAANGTNLSTAGNWTIDGVNPATTLPDGNNGLGEGFQDIAQWDGKTTTNLVVGYTTSWPDTGFGSFGVNLVLTTNQTNDVQIISPVALSAGVGVNHVTNDSANAALTLGDNTANNWLVFGRPAGAIHYYVNNSTAPATINPSIRFQAGGGAGYTYQFGGSGNWIVNSFLMPDNQAFSPSPVTVDGPGTVFWIGGKTGSYNPNSGLGPVTVNGGALVIKSSGLFTGTANQAISNNATLVFDAPAQSQNLSGVMSGAGSLIVSNGTLTLSSGASDFSGNFLLRGGTLVANGTENIGVSGPFGTNGTISFEGGTLGFSVNNVFDYSPRFSTAVSQAYSIDTGGQNVTFTNGLNSSGATLTKLGNGTLTLASGTSTYSGLTTITLGKLVLQGPKTGTGNITVADGAALGVTDGGTQVTPGTLTLGTSSSATLEFNNVNSTTTAPLAAGTISAAGTVTININSGSLTPGQSYPLFSWTSGSAPAVNLATLNGFIGNLTTNGNSLQLNVTATAYRWTGNTDGNWDLSTGNNWFQNGGPVTFANGGPVLFDDTSTRTNVTINALVQPTTVTVNVETNAYTITSSGGNNLGGNATLAKSGNGSLALSGGANTYTGATTVSDGTLTVGAVANGGAASDIGQSSSSAANLVLNGGALQYTGGGANSDRLFTLGTGGGTIDSSGAGALVLNNTGSLGYSGNGPRVLTLTGIDGNDNTLAAVLANNGGPTSLVKNGAGKWVLTGTNAYSGGTTISAGTLQVGAGGPGGTLGSGSILNNGGLDFRRSVNLTVSAVISGTGSVTNSGSGTLILTADNTYAGGTTISAGTLQLGNGGASGKLASTAPIVNDGTFIFNSSGTFQMLAGGVISGTGNLIKRGSGLLQIFGANTYTGSTAIEGGTLQVCSGNVGALASPAISIATNTTLLMVRQDNAVFIYAGNISGPGRLWKDVNNPNPGDVTLTGTNTYTGRTFIAGGGIILGDNGITPYGGSIVGDVIFTNSPVNDTDRSITFNWAENVTFNNNILGAVVSPPAQGNAGRVVQNGVGTVTLTGNNTYPAGTTINTGTLQVGNGGTTGSIGNGNITDNGILAFNRSDSVTINAVISGGGALEQRGSGTLTLNASNTYSGFTTVSNGTLVINGENFAGSTFVYGGTLGGTGILYAPVTLEAGTTLAPGTSVGTFTILSDLSIGGNVAIEVNKSLSPSNDVVVATGLLLTNTGTGTLTVANLGPALAVGDKFTLFSQPLLNGAALTVKGSGANWANNLAVDGSISVVSFVPAPTLNFTQTGNSLQFTWTGDFKLQAQTNSISVGLSSNWANYPGGGASPVTVPIDATKGTVLFRLVPTP